MGKDQDRNMKHSLLTIPLNAKPWRIDGKFDDGVSVGICSNDSTDEGFILAEVLPMDGVDLDHWGKESIARAHAIAAVPRLIFILTEIRRKAYAASLADAPRILQECAKMAEDALRIAERGK